MTTITLMPDVPCCYPTTLGANITTVVGNTPKLLGVFRNESLDPVVRAILQTFNIVPHNPSADTLTTIQFVGLPDVAGGVWNGITGSHLEINTTATVTNGKVAFTEYSDVSAAHGNTPVSATFSSVDASGLGLVLYTGQTFAIFASTEEVGATVDIAWSVNWLEKD
jgi:hypothetical protein